MSYKRSIDNYVTNAATTTATTTATATTTTTTNNNNNNYAATNITTATFLIGIFTNYLGRRLH